MSRIGGPQLFLLFKIISTTHPNLSKNTQIAKYQIKNGLLWEKFPKLNYKQIVDFFLSYHNDQNDKLNYVSQISGNVNKINYE